MDSIPIRPGQVQKIVLFVHGTPFDDTDIKKHVGNEVKQARNHTGESKQMKSIACKCMQMQPIPVSIPMPMLIPMLVSIPTRNPFSARIP